MSRIVIISGLSGSGKSTVLNTLEDNDFFCIDNLPISMLSMFIEQTVSQKSKHYENIAIGIDSRSDSEDIKTLLNTVKEFKNKKAAIEIIFLNAELNTLLTRYSETRRKHPLTSARISLREAIHKENDLLAEIANHADLTIDTSTINVRQLRALISKVVVSKSTAGLTLLLQSFGFKNGVPRDSDFVFDVRCLPNPYWRSDLRDLSGQDSEVIQFLEEQSEVANMIDSITCFLEKWIPCFNEEDRSYLTVSIGCTGGHHRSVYCINRLESHFTDKNGLSVSVRHRELE